jgi:pseudouridine-5'-phosphate glycosidase
LRVERRGARPRVALETAFLTTGLPDDVRLLAAASMAAAVRERGAEPVFVGVMGGKPAVGIDVGDLEELARSARKLSTRDLPVAAARGESGGTTVAATLFLAHREGVEVAATGGIGGVHPGGARFDESADLAELGRTPITLVCSGAKAILDLPATLERLDSLSVTVLGYGTDELPAFWSANSGLPLKEVVENAEEAATVLREARALGLPGAILVCVPPPTEAALSREESERAVAGALEEAEALGISGAALTPFLLGRVAQITEGRSLRANVALLENNAAVAAEIAVAAAG